MTRKLITVAALTLLLPACAKSAQSTEPATADDVAETDEEGAPETDEGEASDEAEELSVMRLDRRHVGDVFVHRFSGAALDEPLMLTEEVVDRDGDALVVEYTLETAETREQLRVLRHERTWNVERVSRLEDGKEIPASLADFEALLERTVVAADSNTGQLAEAEETCVVGETELACTSRKFEVTIGGESATLVVTSSEDLPGRDIGGVLESDTGEVLYRAELVEVERGGESVASR